MGGYIIEERGLVNMKGKGEVRTYWLKGHVKGIVHRRESMPSDFLQVPPYLYSGSDIKKRSSNCVLSRKGSLVAFKNSRTDGSNLNISNLRLPAFLRLKANDSNSSIKINSPKQGRKILRQSRLSSRDQISDSEELSNHLNPNTQTHSILKTSSNFVNKSSDRLNTLDENNAFAVNQKIDEIKHESLTPLLSDDNQNPTNEFQEHNLLLDCDGNDGKYSRQSSEVPLLTPKTNNNEFSLSKKWNSCTELGCDKTVSFENNKKSSNDLKNSTNNITKTNPSVKEWLIGFVKPNKIINDEIREEKVENILKRRASNCDFVIKSLNDCENRIESSV